MQNETVVLTGDAPVPPAEPQRTLAPPEGVDPLVKRLFVGIALSALGSGLTMPFLYVYLAEVRGIPTATVGLVFAFMGLLGFIGSPLGGTLIDRVGPRPVMLVGLTTEAVGVASLALVQTTAHALAVAAFITLGTVGLYPAATAMLTRLVPESRRQKVYGYQFMLLNAGLGVGGVVSAVLVRTSDPASFERLYLIDAASYVAYFLVVLSLPRGTGGLGSRGAAPAEDGVPGTPPPGWSTVLKDRTLLRVVSISILAVTFGYAQFEAGFAAYAVHVAGIPAHYLGWAFGANTAAIVLGQLVTLRLIKGRRRTRMLAVCAGIWSLSWAVIAASDAVDGWTAVALVVAGLGIFGLGETLWAPLAPAIVNDLAVEELRGRYNALQGMTWTVAMIVGPALAGLLIGNDLAHVWVACTVGGTAVAAVLLVRLGRHLTPAQDGLAADGADVAA
ncbi:MDR family MFS transporter [Nocardioides mesophilus]|uniref:MFS transporter n=1 Tax=Nocardioides mesophilus TaxID=433659 RepID=A0A7G9RBM3_9ACTN|nr:MFS transporter [Nocardioides mesophilus]QNN52998.1 MFS transporter [Nocardioides mesophilus]